MDKSKTTEPVRRLTDQEIADLRADMQQAAEWTRKELARRRQDKATAPLSESQTSSATCPNAVGARDTAVTQP